MYIVNVCEMNSYYYFIYHDLFINKKNGKDTLKCIKMTSKGHIEHGYGLEFGRSLDITLAVDGSE